MTHTCDDHSSIAWPLIIIATIYGLPLAGCVLGAWLAWRTWRTVRRGA